MLIFQFNKEYVGEEIVYRPRIPVRLTKSGITIEVFALIDSGADRTVIPAAWADALKLEKGKEIETSGISGSIEGYESWIDLIFTDDQGKSEKISRIPVYVLYEFNDVVIGRNKIFDIFRITFEKLTNRIIFDKMSATD